MLTYKHRITNQEVQVKENSQAEGVYKGSPSWVLITDEYLEELKTEETQNVRIDNGTYNGLNKTQLKDILDERNVKYSTHDKISDLINRLKENDLVMKKQIKQVEHKILFTDNLI